MAHDQSKDPYSRPFYRWYVISILALAYAVSYIDRMIISLMVDPIKQTLDLSDTQISPVSYTHLTLPTILLV